MKKTKRSLITSLVTLLLCSAMFVGSTFAWFTDTVSNTGNRIQAGTLDIKLYEDTYNDDGTFKELKEIKDGSAPIFNYDKWEPGYTDYHGLTIKNAGNLALKFKLDIISNTPSVGSAKLEDVIDVYVKVLGENDSTNKPASFDAVKETGSGFKYVGTLASLLDSTDSDGSIWGILLADGQSKDNITNDYHKSFAKVKNESIQLVLHMQENAGNEYQGLSVGGGFALNLYATQYTFEKDGFDSEQYDAQAEYPIVSSGSATISGPVDEDLSIKTAGNIKEGNVPKDAANDLFDNMKVAGAESNDLTLTLKVTDNGNTTEGASEVVNLNIDMIATMVSKKEGVETTNQKDVKELSDYTTIKYQLPSGKENVIAKHNGVAMKNSTNTADDQGAGIYSYDKPTGDLTIKTKTLSPFTVSYDLDNWLNYADGTLDITGATIEVDTPEKLAQIAKLVNSGNNLSNNTVKLTSDIDLSGKLWTSIGKDGKRFCGVFDGDNHTISNLTSVLDSTSKTQYGNGFFGDITGGAIIKNFTISNADVFDKVDGKGNIYGIVCGYAYGNATFENIKVVNSNVSGFGKVAAILGMAADPNGTTTIKNCVVENTTIKGAYNVAPFVGLLQNDISISGCSASATKWEYSPRYGADCYQIINDVVDSLGKTHNGTYWKYSDTIYYAAYAGSYNEQSEATLTEPFADVTVDAVCHN